MYKNETVRKTEEDIEQSVIVWLFFLPEVKERITTKFLKKKE